MGERVTGSPLSRHAFSFLFLVVACGSGLGLLGKIQLLRALLHLPSNLLMAGCLVLICLPLFWKLLLPYKKTVAIVSAALLVFIGTVVFHKVASLHSVGRGSDQAECVVSASGRLIALKWPYEANLLWSHNPMSCGAGWVMLQAPSIKLAGYPLTQVLLWFTSFFFIWRSAGKEFALALASLVGLCPGVWLSAANGSDFLAFGIAIVAITLTATRSERSRRGSVLFIVIAALIYQFRTPFVVMPGLLRKSIGLRSASLIGFLAIAMQTIFFAWDPYDYIQSGPMHIIRKAFGNTSLIGKPHLMIAVTVVCLTLALLLTLWIGRYLNSAVTSLAFLLILLGVPAVVDLFRKLHESVSPLQAIGTWEGGPWLAACVPLAAMLTLAPLFPSISNRAEHDHLQQTTRHLIKS